MNEVRAPPSILFVCPVYAFWFVLCNLPVTPLLRAFKERVLM